MKTSQWLSFFTTSLCVVLLAGALHAAEITFDFESGDLRGWTATGTAFAHQPTEGDNSSLRGKPAKPQGHLWIGTYENCPKGGTPGTLQDDGPTGTLTSAPFKLEKPWLSFLVGGGSRQDKTYVAIKLAKGGTEIFRACGLDSEELRRVSFDATKFVGQEIVIEIVDQASDGWGHINFDDFQQNDKNPEGAAVGVPVASTDGPKMAAGLSPQDAVKAMTLADGFTAKLVAGEPELQQPVAYCFDDRGRIWILECYEYPRGQPIGQKGKDRILILDNFDANGKAQSVKVFYEGLNLATGIEVGYGGVFVGCAPDLLFIPDRNHDDIPDGEPEVLLTGFGHQDTHELLNSFNWGPDGWLYGCHGVFNAASVQGIKFSCAVWRYHPVTKKFEIFAEGGSNQWGVDFDDVGNAFMTCCVIPHIYHVVPGGLYIRQAGQNSNPYAYGEINTIADHRHYMGNQWNDNDRHSSDSLGGGHAHCGALIYLGDSFPPEYRNTILMGNIHGNRVNRDILARSKSGYVAHHGPDFMRANDKWFMPTSLKLGPDGSVYVSDWCDKQHCHSSNTAAWDRSNGRLYKIEYAGTKAAGQFDLSKLSDDELVALLSDRNDWKVRHARRILTERKPAGVIPALKSLALNGTSEEVCLRGLWALYCVGGFDEQFGQQTLASKHPWVRAWTVRFLGETSTVSAPLLSMLTEMAKSDPAPEVRSQLASTCQRLKQSDTIPLLHALMLHDEDLNDQNTPLLIWIAYEQKLLDRLPEAMDFLKGAGANSKLVGDYILPRVVRRLTSKGDAASLEACIQLASDAPAARQTVLSSLMAGLKGRGTVAMPRNWPAFASSQSASNLHGAVLLLSAQFGDKDVVKEMHQRASDQKLSSGERIDAIHSLADAKSDESPAVLFQIIDAKPSEEVSREAIRALATFASPSIGKGILERWAGFSPTLRVDCLDLVCGRADSASQLMDAVASNSIPRGDISPSAIRKLRELKNTALTTRIESVWGRVRDHTPDAIKAQIEKMRRVVMDGSGDSTAGAAVFSKTCMPCHAIFGKGNAVGPELTGSNRKDLNYLLENIVDPNAVVGAPYYVWAAKMKDGRVVSGIIAEQDDKTVTLKRENNSRDVLQRADMVFFKDQGISLMPEGLPESLKPQEFRDLIKFLQSDGWPQGRAENNSKPVEPMQEVELPKPDADGWISLFNGKDLSGWDGDPNVWSVKDGYISGKSEKVDGNTFLIFKHTFSNFVLEAQCMLIKGRGFTNSGIQYRSKVVNPKKWVVHGYQADVGEGYWGDNYDEGGRALLWKGSPEAVKTVKLYDDWNKYIVTANGSKLKQEINGVVSGEMDDQDEKKRALSGIIAIQYHDPGLGFEVRFKDVRIKLLPPTDGK